MRRLIILGAAMLALAAGSVRAAGPQTYTDPVGDNQGVGPDVRSATATSDGSGDVTIAVDVAAPLAGSDTLQLEIDADGTMTGSPGGYDVNFTFAGGTGKAYRWSGSKWEAASSKSLDVQASGTIVTFRFSRGEFDIVQSMRFLVLGTGGTSQIGDNAPDDTAGWVFDDAATPPIAPPPTTTEPATTTAPSTTTAPKAPLIGFAAPKSVRAGGTFVVRLRLADIRATTKVSCAARSGSKPIRVVRRSAAAGAAACWLRVPRSAKKNVRGSVGVALGDLRVTRSFSVRVVR